MKLYSLHTIASIAAGQIIQHQDREKNVEYLCTDSRKILYPERSLFFALKTERADGHKYIKNCYDKGVRSFIVAEDIDVKQYPEAGFIKVNDTLAVLQKLAAYHRTHLNRQPTTDNRQPATGKSAVLHSPGAACENIRSMAGTNRAWLRRGIR